jgi:myosin heavy subunit
VGFQDYVLGKSMVFIRDAKTLHSLEEPRARLLPHLAVRLQARVRAFMQRRRFLAAVHNITVAEAQARRVINVIR